MKGRNQLTHASGEWQATVGRECCNEIDDVRVLVLGGTQREEHAHARSGVAAGGEGDQAHNNGFATSRLPNLRRLRNLVFIDISKLKGLQILPSHNEPPLWLGSLFSSASHRATHCCTSCCTSAMRAPTSGSSLSVSADAAISLERSAIR